MAEGEVQKSMNGFQKVATAEQHLKDNRIWSGEDVDGKSILMRRQNLSRGPEALNMDQRGGTQSSRAGSKRYPERMIKEKGGAGSQRSKD